MRFAVVGGGIAGLSAALRLRSLGGPSAQVVLVDSAHRLGGKLFTGALAENGAEAFLSYRPDGAESAAVELARRVGLGDALRHPAQGRAAIAVDGRLVPIPAGTLIGVPTDVSTLDGLATATDGDHDEGRPVLADGDVAVGRLVRERLGDQVADRLVDPMLGGVYAGRADDLSLAATMPALYEAARKESTLVGAARAAARASRRPPGAPVFSTVDGGMSRLVTAIAEAAAPVLKLGQPVREITPHANGWRLTLGPVPAPETLDVDAIVLAVPAKPTARLLSTVAPVASEAVRELDYASIGLVTLALPSTVELPDLSGFLVPASEGYAVKAATFFTTKWAHLARPDGRRVVRASLGRYGETEVLQRSDTELVELVRQELGLLLGTGPLVPDDAAVHRWGGALPQYRPGHLNRVAAARAALPPTIALAGAALDGVGIPACVTSGESAAGAVWAALGESPHE